MCDVFAIGTTDRYIYNVKFFGSNDNPYTLPEQHGIMKTWQNDHSLKAFDVNADVITALEGGKCSNDISELTEFTGIIFHYNEIMAHDSSYRTDHATCFEATQGGITYSVFEVLF